MVGGNEEIAKNAVSSVLDQLESNELLIEEICGPGPKFKPSSRTGKSWSQSGFTVGTRTVTGIKSPTMVGLGRGGKILSRDCDIIIDKQHYVPNRQKTRDTKQETKDTALMTAPGGAEPRERT